MGDPPMFRATPPADSRGRNERLNALLVRRCDAVATGPGGWFCIWEFPPAERESGMSRASRLRNHRDMPNNLMIRTGRTPDGGCRVFARRTDRPEAGDGK